MKVNKISFAVFVLLLFLLSFTASAQRTMPGQPALRLAVLYNGQRPGAEAFFSSYTGNGYWEAGIVESQGAAPTSNGPQVDFLHTTAQGGYFYRLLATRNRLLNLYCGGGILAGIESTDPWGSLPSYLETGLAAHRFLYGIYGNLTGEVFLGNMFAFTISGSVPVNFSSAFSYVRWSVGIGIKLTLR